MCINVEKTETLYPIDNWKAYLSAKYAAGTPVQIVYKIAEPVSFKAEGAVTLPGLQNINTVLSDADSLTVSAREDMLHVLSGIQSSE